MSIAQTGGPTPRRPLRLWPGVVAAVLLVLVKFGLPLVFPDGQVFAMLGGLAAAAVILVWWVFFSRASWPERLGAIVLMIVALFATSRIVHASIRGGMMGMMLPFSAIPGLSLALVAWAVASRRFAAAPRRAALVAAILLASGVWTLLRTDGLTGDGSSQLAWRWTPTAEERLLAQAGDEPPAFARGATASPSPAPAAADPVETPGAPPALDEPAHSGSAASPTDTPEKRGVDAEALAVAPASAAAETEGDRPAMSARDFTRVEWPGFRGPARDSVVRDVRIETDWSRTPPVELWRRPIGPGWSSFAVQGNLLYTQEQRGDDELVSAYDLTTGEPVWRHHDSARFWESNGGAGPRATPAVGNGRVYTQGATGILNALDAENGAVVWSRNAVTDTGMTIPGWGIAGSPMVAGDLVIVAVSGALAAYDIATGDLRWVRESAGGGYSSPHPVTIDGTAQILFMGGGGVTGVAPADGALLWEHPWQGGPIVQPAAIADGDILITTADPMGGLGIRRIAVGRRPGGWTVEERWTSRGLKPYFNDFVVHEGHAFGFDGFILSCIDLEDGTRTWKGGRYGHGQMVLLPDQDLLIVLSEKGDLALVKATPDQFTELARFPAIEGKTWNHPVLVGDILLVRNDQEMAAFRLTLLDR